MGLGPSTAEAEIGVGLAPDQKISLLRKLIPRRLQPTIRGIRKRWARRRLKLAEPYHTVYPYTGMSPSRQENLVRLCEILENEEIPAARALHFLLKASNETPRRLKHERRGTIGLRVPDHPVTQMLLTELGEPVMSSTLLLPGEELPRTDAKEIYELLEQKCRPGARRRQLRPRADLGHRFVRGSRGSGARGARRCHPFCGRGARIMTPQCGREELVFFINNECKHWIYLYFFTRFRIGQSRYSLRSPCMKSHMAGWRDTSAIEPQRCSGA